jgi:two-component system NtrC family sensor kinase
MEQSSGIIEVRTSTKGRYVIVEIEDTGPGISRENLGRIFEPFFTTKPEGKGTGLGLSICYAMMKKMKGDITVRSEEGKGTVFHLFFPL